MIILNYNNFSKIPHNITALDLWNKKPFDEGHALVDIMLNSCDYTKGKYLEGKVYRSKRWFSKRWGWSMNKVDRFLRDLEQNDIIKMEWDRNRDKNGTVLSLVNKGKTAIHRDRNRDKNGVYSRIKEEGGYEPNGSTPQEEWEEWT